MSSKVRRAGAELSRSGRQAGRRRASDSGFDRWLNKQLHQIYDPVLSEAVPDDMLRLLESLDGDDEAAEDGGAEAPAEGKAPRKE